ncbi:MAG: glycosyltransferase, partial [Myxococcota bacterium]
MSESAQRVTYVLTHLSYGGAETQVVELCRHVRQLGWEPSIISLMTPSGLTGRLEELGIPWSTLGVPARVLNPRLVTGLRRELARLAPTVVHSHTLPANFAARAVRPLLSFPVLVTSAHNIWEGGFLRMLFYRFTDRLADLTTNCSEAAVQRYVDIKAAPAERIRYMPNGIDIDRFAPDGARRTATREALGLGDAFTSIAIGRFTEQKDWPNLLEAASRALRPEDRLLVVGDGELR